MAPRAVSPARRRYYVRLAASLTLYMALLAPVVWIQSRGAWPAGPARYLLAILPAIPTFGVIWAIIRYLVEEEDEYFRYLHMRAALAAIGITLAVCTAWGFLSTFAGVPAANMMYVFVIFCAALFPAMAWISWRSR